MKLLILFLISFSVFANFAPLSKVVNGEPLTVYIKKKICEKRTSDACISIPTGYNSSFYDLTAIMVDDIEKPIYESKSNVLSCEDQADCIAKSASHSCDNENGYQQYMSEDYSEIYCTKLLGYEQKDSGFKHLVLNAANKAAFDAAEQARVVDAAKMTAALNALSCGQKVVQRMLVQNSSKTLTITQVKQMVDTYKGVKDLLETGSLESAASEITSLAADGVLVTEGDRTALLAELNGCK